jgi:proprotein convertase subtilisin/kexin type 5
MYGFFKNFTNGGATDFCVDLITPGLECPQKTYADKELRECLPCSEDCDACEHSSEYCTQCPDGKLWIPATGECVDSCPIGTYVNGSNCDRCQENILNCNPTTGIFNGNPEDKEYCSMNCNGCTVSHNFCIDCAAGYFPAPDGRCVKECPAGTYLEDKDGMKSCNKCGNGCTKCILEPAK